MSIVAEDCYHLDLKVGDFVIPVCSEVLALNITGEIKNIFKANGYSWLKIFDTKRGYAFEAGFNSSNFTTQKRFDEHKRI